MMMRKLFFEWRYLVGRAPWDTGVSPPELLSFIDTHTAGRAIDLGCGTGSAGAVAGDLKAALR